MTFNITANNYLRAIGQALASSNATEHTYRPFLKNLVESMADNLTATNEPKRKGGNAPDFIVTQNGIPLGYIETKDLGENLDKVEQSEQLKRYLATLNNLILTDYAEFRWFVRGEKRLTARLATVNRQGELKVDNEGVVHVANLFQAFLTTQTEIVNTSRELARRMADKARLLRDIVHRLMTDKKSDNLNDLFKTFQQVLIPDLVIENRDDINKPSFADLYAQTIAYGLFTARIFTPRPPFTRDAAARRLPKTNPFLQKLFRQIAGYELEDEPHVWAVDDLAELLNRTDIAAILQDFGKRTRQEDPVVHFYETFLAEYDSRLRELRGVYYTPQPVVSYIVRSVDQILKRDFEIKDGLADATQIKINTEDENGDLKNTHKVLILDPATGTGTFLYHVINHIFDCFAGQHGMWKSYVSEHLLPRLFGFELLVAPYSIAHLKLGLRLSETGYEFKERERLNIFLTNTLEEVDRLTEARTAPLARWINDEADAASAVKQHAPVMVVLGNPPYSGHSANKGRWIQDLLRGRDSHTNQPTGNYFEVDGQPLGERNPKWLNDDYVKFIRFAQWRIERTGYGVLAFITNHGYLDNPTFRGMRQSLMQTFDDIYLLDLHGNVKKKERAPDGSKDENVFDIQQGVAIGIFVRRRCQSFTRGLAKIHHTHLHGVREIYDANVNDEKELIGGKYAWLERHDIATTNWTELKPSSPFYLFVPQDTDLREEYGAGWKITVAMPFNSMGITTGDDKHFVAFDKHRLNVEDKRLSSIKQVAYRPFDERILYYETELLARARNEFMQHLAEKENFALCAIRRPRNGLVGNFFVTNRLTDKCIISTLDNAQILPLYLYPTERQSLFDDEPSTNPHGRRANLAPEFVAEMTRQLKLKYLPDGKGDLQRTFAPEDIFAYLYAVFHSPAYRTRYAEQLKIDFPRVPLTSNRQLFRSLVEHGAQLVKLHLLEAELELITAYPVEGDNAVETIKYADGKVWINRTQFFDGVPDEVWNFHIGGYQVAHKWLKDRKGRQLTFQDLQHYQNIIAALNRTITLMSDIDETIEQHGGFPLS